MTVYVGYREWNIDGYSGNTIRIFQKKETAQEYLKNEFIYALEDLGGTEETLDVERGISSFIIQDNGDPNFDNYVSCNITETVVE